jgi:thymidine kinase
MERLGSIAGSMFSGKTDELIRQVEREEFAGIVVQIFKPKIDVRWGNVNSVRSHAGREKEAISVESSRQILTLLNEDTKVVAIDEAQFMDKEIVEVVDELLEKDIKVIVAGLPLDFKGEPFGSMPVLLAKSDVITRLTAICTYKDDGTICGQEATRTQRLVDGRPAKYTDPLIVIGAEESYAPRCPTHHIVPEKPRGVMR